MTNINGPDTMRLLSSEQRLSTAPSAKTPSGSRDLRLDFFRGLALIFIFIDHMAGNSLMHVTMRAFGISDAAEVFVLIAGFSAFLAYSGHFEREGLLRGTRRIFSRIRDLYVAHILLVVVSVSFLSLVARYFENPLYFEYINLTPFTYDPLAAIWRFVALLYQPGYLNILPLYIVLLALFPVVWWGMRRSPEWTLTASGAVWLISINWHLNLPSWPDIYGWYFNPLAWQFLFIIGTYSAVKARSGMTLPRSPLLVVAATLYLLLGVIVSAPWINLPYLHLPRLVAYDALGHVSKTYLSAWRIGHVLAAAYLTVLLVPASVSWLHSKIAQPIVNCGRNSLDIFCLGTLLSFCGFAVLLEAGRTWEFQLVVNLVGIGAMLLAAEWVTLRKSLKTQATVSTPLTSPAEARSAETL